MKDDATLVRAIATDNLVTRSGFRTPASELPALANFLIGKPALINHDFRHVDGGWGRIASTFLQQSPVSDVSDHNRAIVAAEGYWQIVCEIAVSPDHPYLQDFAYERKGELSITFVYESIRCPGCSCGESIWSRHCPNDPWELPYLERFGVCDALEISLVCVPAVRAARVLLEG